MGGGEVACAGMCVLTVFFGFGLGQQSMHGLGVRVYVCELGFHVF